jgi:DNA-binding transcriptional MocR family regulator
MTKHVVAATTQVCPVLGRLASRYRRELGPTAWVVLEAVFETSSQTDGGTVSQTSVRVLADELGLAKDRVARALRLLADRHLIAFDAGHAETADSVPAAMCLPSRPKFSGTASSHRGTHARPSDSRATEAQIDPPSASSSPSRSIRDGRIRAPDRDRWQHPDFKFTNLP